MTEVFININIQELLKLFYLNAKYETIDFNGLYSLLRTIAEREREQDSEEVKPVFSRYRKK